jgi:hypothetical protein
MQIASRHFGVALSSLLAAVATGCGSDGPQLTPVEGVVTLDGQPLAGASVLFQPDAGGRPAIGLSDSQGKFVMTTFEEGDGAQVGMNKVSVAKEERVAPKAKLEEGEYVDIKFLTPVKYASPNTSDLSVDVQPGMGPVTLELKR